MKTELREACVDVVTDLIGSGESFTAYDVTCAVRDAGHWAEHEEVREYVHERMQDEINNGREYKKSYDAVAPGKKAVRYVPDEDVDDGDLTLSDFMDDDED